MSPHLTRRGDKARAPPALGSTSRYHPRADLDHVRACYRWLTGKKAVGVDAVTKARDAGDWETHLQDGSARLQRMGDRPQPKRRLSIPQPGSETGRPLGLSRCEDKSGEWATKRVSDPRCEALCADCSYGYRPQRRPHQGLDVLGRPLQQKRVSHLVEADIRGFGDAVHHEWWRKFLGPRSGDKRVRRLIRRR